MRSAKAAIALGTVAALSACMLGNETQPPNSRAIAVQRGLEPRLVPGAHIVSPVQAASPITHANTTMRSWALANHATLVQVASSSTGASQAGLSAWFAVRADGSVMSIQNDPLAKSMNAHVAPYGDGALIFECLDTGTKITQVDLKTSTIASRSDPSSYMNCSEGWLLGPSVTPDHFVGFVYRGNGLAVSTFTVNSQGEIVVVTGTGWGADIPLGSGPHQPWFVQETEPGVIEYVYRTFPGYPDVGDWVFGRRTLTAPQSIFEATTPAASMPIGWVETIPSYDVFQRTSPGQFLVSSELGTTSKLVAWNARDALAPVEVSLAPAVPAGFSPWAGLHGFGNARAYSATPNGPGLEVPQAYQVRGIADSQFVGSSTDVGMPQRL